uniref:Uncharacterized protein n=1 Tax=Rhizophora mucronata TaxID=61149 RepID=A0A2P2P5V2_RHIMU
MVWRNGLEPFKATRVKLTITKYVTLLHGIVEHN